ncbi:hypothetical protein P2318_06165 [Myxococcaceae bacterium GXIMD 01537]
MSRRRFTPSRRRGQTLILGVVTLIVMALVVFVTINLTVSTQQKIALQNYTDAKAYSTAVAEARALNYFAYTNRAIASAYVGIANVSAYMSEAAMLADLKMSASGAMGMIAAEEYAQCFCCCSPVGCAPCCFQHCIHGFEATMNSIGLLIDWVSGKMGSKLQKLDKPAADTIDALHTHIQTLHLSQTAAKANMLALLATGSPGKLKDGNMDRAAGVTRDVTALAALNIQQWNKVFYDDKTKKKRIMAETVNATRHDFAWNRDGSPIAQALLFPPPMLNKTVKSTNIWMGPTGNWVITQTPDVGFSAGGRTGVTDGFFPMQMGGVAIVSQDTKAGTVQDKTISSFDSGILAGQWRHGAGVGVLPMLSSLGPGEFATGKTNRHRADLGTIDALNRPHKGSAHSKDLEMDRFMEFDISTSAPFNQPAVYAGSTTDSRVNQYGLRGTNAYEVNSTGTVRMDTGQGEAKLTLSNNRQTKAFSKAQVYYHRMGDWRDYPNLFNPYWRAKLHPLTTSEAVMAVGLVDANSAAVVTGASIAPMGGSSAVNVK